MTLSAHQPAYLPWLGYFHKLAHCDLFVVLDDVEMSGKDRDNWVNRCVIAGTGGETMLTVPVRRRNGATIRETEIDGTAWLARHVRALEQTYARAPYVKEASIQAQMGVMESRQMLRDVWVTVLITMLGLDIHRPAEYASSMGIGGKGEDRLLDMCRHFNADRFLFGRNGRNYVTMDKWRRAGIEPVFQDFTVPEYPRRGPPPKRILSVVDCIANAGLEYTREVVCG